MINKNGKEIKVHRSENIDYELKYKWTRGAVVPR